MEEEIEEEIDESHTIIIDKANPSFYFYAVTIVFFTLLVPSWPIVTLWSSGLAVLGAYLFFRNRCLIPNLLIHLKPVIYKEQQGSKSCRVCGNSSCSRHTSIHQQLKLMPWEGMLVPKTVDDILSKFLKIIVQRFVNSWHNDLTNDQTFPGDTRYIIRYGVCVLVNRAAQIDMPKVVTGPLMQTIAEHIDVYLKIRRRMPLSASNEEIREEVWHALGHRLHVGIRGQLGDLEYFRNLTRSILPLLLPPGLAESRVLNLFLEELFATKVMIPAMNYVSTPDFINKIVILIFDKESKLVRMVGPQSQLVPFLEEFALRNKRSALQVPINHLMKSQKLLYPFMQFLKKSGGIHILQFYLSCNELRTSISKLDIVSLHEKAAFTNVDQIQRLYNLYMSNTAENKIYFHPSIIGTFEQILLADYPNELKLLQLLEYRLLDLACNTALVTLEQFFCPNYFHSEYYHDAMMPVVTCNASRRSLYTDSSSLSKHFEKWRKRRKTVYTSTITQETAQASPKLLPSTESPSPIPTINRPRSESTSSLSSSPVCDALEETVVVSIPSYVQVVDWEIVSTGIKPFTAYWIVSKMADGDDKFVYRVKRRYKEFIVLDTRIHQFYNDVNVHLPPKKTIKNMDKIFIESRAKELEKYLTKLIKEPEVQGSQLLRSFLTDTDDISLFMPNTMGDKAGKIIKSVPGILKKEVKGQHLENLLQTMESCVATPPRQYSSEKKALCEEQMQKNESIIRKYEKDVASDKSCDTTNVSWFNHPVKTGTGVQLNGVMDLLVYLGIHVYGVSQTQLASLLVVKLLGQSSIEAYIQHMLSGRIEMLLMENKACELIELLQTNLFFDNSPPRSSADKQERFNEATHTVLTRPPDLLIKLMGRDSFETNTKLLLEGLQDPLLNKQMLFSMLDVVLWELFPELRTTTDSNQT